MLLFQQRSTKWTNTEKRREIFRIKTHLGIKITEQYEENQRVGEYHVVEQLWIIAIV